jgi:protein gp37
MKHELPIAAEVRPLEDLAALAHVINAEHAAGEEAARRGLEHFRAAGLALQKAKAQCGQGKWLSWLKRNVKFDRRTATNYMRVAEKWETVSHAEGLRDALRLLTEDAPAENGEAAPPSPPPEFVTLPQWREMGKKIQRELLRFQGDAHFNDQGETEGIYWAKWSWNPVTGCLHNCPYCYARDGARRFYEQGFEPSLWPGRLSAPRLTPFPQEAIEKLPEGSWRRLALGNVFTCSMADLFGRWVPTEWIEAVLAEVRAAPQWNFLFLTKFPIRMAEFSFPDNTWVGTTVDCQARVDNAEKAFRKIKAGVKWLSIEPMIEPLTFSDLGAFGWIVLGGASKSSQTPAWIPPRDWVAGIEAAAARVGVPVFEKPNLIDFRHEYPGAPAFLEPAEAPAALRYLPGD